MAESNFIGVFNNPAGSDTPPDALDTAADRINAGQLAGDDYTSTMEDIRSELNQAADKGTSVGTMVAATIAMTEADITFSTKKGLATNVSNKVKEAAKKIGDS